MDDLISVIVPVYKVEKYLDRCVESITNQTYKNLEIILVDDGSPDNCPKMCDEWAQKDSRIKVIHKENGGLSDARNAGLDVAAGDYISFVDSDDWIDLETYELVLKKMHDTKSQIGSFDYLSTDASQVNPNVSLDFDILDSEKAIENTIENIGVRTVVWNKIYSRFILDNLRFRKGKLHEDEFFTFYALDMAESIVYLHRQCYFYYQRSSSIMGTYNISHIDMLEGVKERMEFVRKKYPSLYSKSKLSLSLCCLTQYTQLYSVLDKSQRDFGKNRIKKIRKTAYIKIKDVKKQRVHFAFFHLLSNHSLGLAFSARILNSLR